MWIREQYVHALKFHANEIIICQSSVCFSLQYYILTLIKLMVYSFLTIIWNSIIGKCTLYLSLILLMDGYVVSDISVFQDWQ